MSFSERLEALAAQATTHQCKLGRQISKLPQGDQDTLNRLFNVPKDAPGRVSNLDIAAALRSEGLMLSNTSVDRHRAKICLCYRDGGAES